MTTNFQAVTYNAQTTPKIYTAKMTFKVDPTLTGNAAVQAFEKTGYFFALTLVYTGVPTTPPCVCVDTGSVDLNGDPIINPIYFTANGLVQPVFGKGVLSSGKDINGNEYTTTLDGSATLVDYIGYGGFNSIPQNGV
jgi:hypothetical protein